MGQRDIREIVAEGQKLEEEGRELLRKQILGTITPEEATRKAQLEAYLLGLVGEAQAQGFGVAGAAPELQETELGLDGDEDLDTDDWGGEELEDEGLQENEGYNPFRY